MQVAEREGRTRETYRQTEEEAAAFLFQGFSSLSPAPESLSVSLSPLHFLSPLRHHLNNTATTAPAYPPFSSNPLVQSSPNTPTHRTSTPSHTSTSGIGAHLVQRHCAEFSVPSLSSRFTDARSQLSKDQVPHHQTTGQHVTQALLDYGPLAVTCLCDWMTAPVFADSQAIVQVNMAEIPGIVDSQGYPGGTKGKGST